MNWLFRLHALVTLAAGVVLIVAPDVIPRTVGIQLPAAANLLCYLLGAVEVSVAVLSYYGATLTDAKARRLICRVFVVLHGLTALVEIYAIAQGVSARLWGNVGLRVGIAVWFGYYGFSRQSGTYAAVTNKPD